MLPIAEALALAARYQEAGNVEATEQLCLQVLQADPSQPDALFRMGLIANYTGRLQQAVDYFKKALDKQPQNPVIHANLGHAFQRLENLNEAAASYRQALQLKPNFVEVLTLLGPVLRELRQLEAAEASLRQAVALRPNQAATHNDLGNVYTAMGRTRDAMAAYEQAVRLQPDLVTARTNLGAAFVKLGWHDEAEATLREVLRLEPTKVVALNQLACVLFQLGKVKEALTCLAEALRIQPDFVSALSNLLVFLNYQPDAQPETLFSEHCRWDAIHGHSTAALPPPNNDRDPERRLRVGYMSVDFRPQALAPFLVPIITHHDPACVDVFCYEQAHAPDAVTAPWRKLAKGWHQIGDLSDALVAEQVRRDGIDILVDLTGQTANNRLRVFTPKTAPVQVTYLGYPNTTGLRAMDYRLTDAVADPPGEAVHHSEELVRLPACFCCYSPQQAFPQSGPLPADRNSRFTFGSLHILAKLNPVVLDAWTALLRALPAARLLIFRNTLTGGAREHLRRQLIERGIGEDRFDLRHETAQGQNHLSIYQEIDLSLDPFPWSGHHTACESLWMGVPMVTLRGNRHAGRMVASVLTQLGLTDWIADTPEEYVRLAVTKAQDLDALRVLRAGLRERMRASPLGDGRRFTRDLENAYREMWRRWCAT